MVKTNVKINDEKTDDNINKKNYRRLNDNKKLIIIIIIITFHKGIKI